MLKDWNNWLVGNGANLENGRVKDFGNPKQELDRVLSGTVIADLSHHGLIRARGSDCCDFLQGQFSNDLQQVSSQHSQLSSYCTPKGRMLAIFLLFQRGEDFYLRMPQEILEPFLNRLRMFVMRADVSLEDAGDQLYHFGLSGPDAPAAIESITGHTPQQNYEVQQHNGLLIIRTPGPHPRFELYDELKEIQAAWSQLTQVATPVGADTWELLDVLAGIPNIYAATSEAFVPQMANLDLVDGVNFQKGCYPGQEIVARTKYLGKLKRRMYLGRIHSDQPPKIGEELFPVSGNTEQAAGKIVSAQPHPGGGFTVLGVIKIAEVESGSVQLSGTNDAIFEVEKLPYSLDSDRNT